MLNTLIYFNVKYFMLKTTEEHKKLSFTHIMKHYKKGGTATPVTRNSAPSPGEKQTLLLRYYPPSDSRKFILRFENIPIVLLKYFRARGKTQHSKMLWTTRNSRPDKMSCEIIWVLPLKMVRIFSAVLVHFESILGVFLVIFGHFWSFLVIFVSKYNSILKGNDREMTEIWTKNDREMTEKWFLKIFFDFSTDNVRTRSDLFYLQPERSCVPDSPVWFSSSQELPEYQIDKMLQRILMVREVQEHMLADGQELHR